MKCRGCKEDRTPHERRSQYCLPCWKLAERRYWNHSCGAPNETDPRHCAACKAALKLIRQAASQRGAETRRKNNKPTIWPDGYLRMQRRAMMAVRYAVETKRLPPVRGQQCADCDWWAECYDHRDYRRPLDVAAVCFSCNQARGHAEPFYELGGVESDRTVRQRANRLARVPE